MSDSDSTSSRGGCVDGVRHQWHLFTSFLWNKETGEIAGRSARSWVEITLFYLTFYGLLAAFWVGMLIVAQSGLPELDEGPKYSDYLSHRGPGVHLIPSADVIGRDKQNIFYITKKDEYLDEIEKFLNEHHDTSLDTNDVNGGKWGECAKKKFKAAWDNNRPCFYFYLNAVHGFVPEPLEEGGAVNIKCNAAKSHYAEQIDETKFFPQAGFDLEKFPWNRTMNWKTDAPLVAAQVVLASNMQSGSETRVICTVEAANIHLDFKKPNIGTADFRLKL